MTETPMVDDEGEKKRDYRRAVYIQIAFLAMALLADEALRLMGVTTRGFAFDGLFHLIGGVYLLALCDMLRNYTRSAWLVRLCFLLFGIAFVLLVVANLVLSPTFTWRRELLLVAHGLLAIVQLGVIAFAIRDLFRSRQTADRLWGSACIYFMSGLAFASIYSTVLILEPHAFGEPLAAEAYIYFETIYLSFNALVGLDTSYPEATRLVRNLALLEGLWSQLYLVLLIGRLMTPSGDVESP
jgi:hypothetical protein